MAQKRIWGPTFEEMLHPEKIPEKTRADARAAYESQPLSPLNLYNINWRDFEGGVRHVVIPREITGIEADICLLIGCFFPTGSHKVGATYSCTVERQARGEISPGRHRLVWPSTGNYGVGGAYVGERMGYDSLVILPEEMSQERFERIEYYGAKYIKTPGCESNVKEIYDKAKELARERDTIIVNQFSEFANYRFHYFVTGNTLLELFEGLKADGRAGRLAALVSAMGSAGTIASGDRIKQVHPETRVVGLEPLQCPTLYCNGFGGHDIQGIGDKHVTWIHNTDNMDAIMCVDEWDSKKGMQLFTEDAGLQAMASFGADPGLLECLRDIFGISSICNILGSIKAARHYGFGRGDMIFTIATDGTDRYRSVLADMNREMGPMGPDEAKRRVSSIFHGQGQDHILDGTAHSHDCWANLKYYTWVEQQGKTVEELRAQRSQEYWIEQQSRVAESDRLIKAQRG
ncbi:MAG: pyridoxal-phosphate dependent enzyme [Proteobacteria bacterium]|nr:pyridoxal-phosphate dependent enzyme [Pseudomonadota bacterium]